MVDWAAAAASIVDRLGADIEYIGDAGVQTVQAVLSRDWQRVEGARGPGVSSRRAEIQITRAALSFEPKQGDRVVIGGVEYSIVSVRPDSEDVSFNLVLKRG